MIQRTSIEAKIKVAPKLSTNNQKVYEFILNRGLYGATDQEIQTNLNLSGDTVRPSRGQLVKNGIVFDSGTTRQNKRGNNCIVWRTIQEGMMI